MDTRIVYTGNEKPVMVTERFNRTTLRYIPYDIVEDNGAYSWRYVLLTPDNFNYEVMVVSIIVSKYELKSALAIISNYLLDPKDSDYKKEFDEFQEWRMFAKDEAKKYFNRK